MKGDRPESVRPRWKPGSMGQLQPEIDTATWDLIEVPRFQPDCLQALGSDEKRGEACSGLAFTTKNCSHVRNSYVPLP